MSSRDISSLIAEIDSEDERKRKQAWSKICADAPNLGARELSQALEKLNSLSESLDVKEIQFQINSILQMLAAQPWRKSHLTQLKEWFFDPFLPRSEEARISNPCACIGVCDREHLRDVQAQLILGRYLDSHRFPDTRFFHIPFEQPNWDDVGLDQINALCVIGRPSMFARCLLLEEVEEQHAEMRFCLPKDDEKWRGKPVDALSIEHFHHIEQKPAIPGGPRILYRVSRENPAEVGSRRTDYAVIQRFKVKSGSREITVIILAGATSLATVGAAQWVTDGRCEVELRRACKKLGVKLEEIHKLEALLKVTAEVRAPARPWKPLGVKLMKFFLNDSRNAVSESVRQITVVSRMPEADSIFIDDDELRVRNTASRYMAAVCKSACRRLEGFTSSIPMESLAADAALCKDLGILHTDGPRARIIDGLRARIFDHLQNRELFGAAMSIEGGVLHLPFSVRHIQIAGTAAA